MSLPAPDEKWGPMQSYLYGEHNGAADALFFHGNGFSAHTYDTLLNSISSEASIRAFDFQGHGRSDGITDLNLLKSWRLFRDNVELALTRNGPSILIAHSLGAVSSLFTTMKHPSLVKALILLEPVFPPPFLNFLLGPVQLMGIEVRGHGLIPQARARRAYFDDVEEASAYFMGRKGLKTWPEDAIRNYAQSILRPRRDGEPGLELSMEREWEARIYANVPAWLWPGKQLDMPILLAYGAHRFSTVSEARVNWFRKRAPRLVEAKHPKAGHMLPVDHAEWTAEQVRSFLRQLG